MRDQAVSGQHDVRRSMRRCPLKQDHHRGSERLCVFHQSNHWENASSVYAFIAESRQLRGGSTHQLYPLCLCSCADCGFSVLPALTRAMISLYLSSGNTRTSVIMPIIEAVHPAASP